jgi:hypothetical protein
LRFSLALLLFVPILPAGVQLSVGPTKVVAGGAQEDQNGGNRYNDLNPWAGLDHGIPFAREKRE